VGGSAERGPGAAQVVSGDHQPNATKGGVGEVDVTPCRRPWTRPDPGCSRRPHRQPHRGEPTRRGDRQEPPARLLLFQVRCCHQARPSTRDQL